MHLRLTLPRDRLPHVGIRRKRTGGLSRWTSKTTWIGRGHVTLCAVHYGFYR
jgi:hypothetical protein